MRCGANHAGGPDVVYACAACGFEALDVVMELPDRFAPTNASSLWRYADLLPVTTPERDTGPLFSVGMTPLHAAPRCAARVGAGEVWIKDDGALPTGSLKDRASAIVAMRAREIGVTRVITASTGNAGVAMAAMGNAAGLEAIVLVPKSAPAGKIAQLSVFGARLVLVDGTYDDAFALSREASQELGWYCRNTAYNPFTVEGKKTVSFEIVEALGGAPDAIYVSVGDGNIITGVHKGLRDLAAVGAIERMPRIIGVQSEGSAAIARAFAAGTDTVAPVEANTMADSIAADRPADGLRALRAARDTGGRFVVVSDEQILEAIALLGRDAAVFAEPAAAAAYAGLCADADNIAADERVVVISTGNGLKDVGAAERAVARPPVIAPTLDAFVAEIDSN